MEFKNLEEIINDLKRKKIQKILISLPEGLMNHSKEILNYFSDFETILSSITTFGACDVPIETARNINAGAIINLGHSEIKYDEFTVYFVEPVIKLPRINLKNIKENTIGLLSTVQYLKNLEKIKKELEALGKKVLMEKGGDLCKHKAQVTGCDIKAANKIKGKVDCFLLLSDGLFHALEVGIETEKPVYYLEGNRIILLDEKIVLKERKKRITKTIMLKNSKRVGIFVSTKLGQKNKKLAEEVIKKLEKYNIKTILIVGEFFSPKWIDNYDFDAYVTTACPRISDDVFRKPVVRGDYILKYL